MQDIETALRYAVPEVEILFALVQSSGMSLMIRKEMNGTPYT